MSIERLVVGTHNRKKGQELADLLTPHGLQIVTLADVPQAIRVAETGDTFAANALLKASEQALHLGAWVLAEDSGLAVDALEGAPGVYSARYAGPAATDEANNRRLLDDLGNTPAERRTAHYVCHVVVCDPDGQPHIRHEAICRGRIRFAPAGTAGFGYDPLFELVEYHRTFGELGAAVKSLLSHRARALRAILPDLVALARR